MKQLKPHTKKFRHLEEDLEKTLENFSKATSFSLGRGFYKVRLKSRDLPRGKSKSFRIIVFLWEIEGLLVPIMIYFKGARADVSSKEIKFHLVMILAEIRSKKS